MEQHNMTHIQDQQKIYNESSSIQQIENFQLKNQQQEDLSQKQQLQSLSDSQQEKNSMQQQNLNQDQHQNQQKQQINLQKQLLQYQQEEEEKKIEISFEQVQNDFFIQLKQLTDVQKYDQAYNLFQNFQKQNNNYNFESLNLEQKESIEDILKVIEDLNFMEQAFDFEQDWNTESFKGNVKVFYKQMPSTQIVSIKVEADLLNMPLFNILSIIYEIELFKHWVPFCDTSKTLKRIKRAQKAVYIKLGLPILSDRECFLNGFGVDRLEEKGSIVIICKSIHHDAKTLKKFDIQIPQNKNVFADIKYFFCQITPMPNNRLLFKSICNVDPQVKFLPSWVLNFFVRKIGTYMLGKIIELAKDIRNTEWEKAIQKEENKSFYQWLQTRLDEFNNKDGIQKK